MAAGTKDDPWQLTTAPGTSSYAMYADREADPPTLVCQVGTTKLTYQLRCIEDLHAWLRERAVLRGLLLVGRAEIDPVDPPPLFVP